jgi:hypothetical protein
MTYAAYALMMRGLAIRLHMIEDFLSGRNRNPNRWLPFRR